MWVDGVWRTFSLLTGEGKRWLVTVEMSEQEHSIRVAFAGVLGGSLLHVRLRVNVSIG